MKYTIDIDEKLGTATVQIGDQEPVLARNLKIDVRRDPVVNEMRTMEAPGHFVHYDEGPVGQLTISAELDFTMPVK